MNLAVSACVARPSKGDRGAHMVKPRDGIAQLLVDIVAESRVSSVSQYVADLLAIHVGLPALVRELNQAAVAHGAPRAVPPLRGGRLMIRPRREVSQRLAHMATDAGYPPGRVSPYIADVLAEHVRSRRGDEATASASVREEGGAIDIQREPAAKTTASRPKKKAVTGREAARAEVRRLAQRAAERRAEEAAREAVRREAAVRAVRHPQPTTAAE